MSLLTNKLNAILGLKEEDIESIISILQQHPKVDQALVFGSRAKGNYYPGSDVDIALKGATLNFNTTSHISYLLNEETQMPYKFDVLNYQTITNVELIRHIDKIGIVIFDKEKVNG
jgi:uncharacterized protein